MINSNESLAILKQEINYQKNHLFLILRRIQIIQTIFDNRSEQQNCDFKHYLLFFKPIYQ